MEPAPPKTVFLKDYQPTPYHLYHHDLTIRLGEDHTEVRTLIRGRLRQGQKAAPLVLHGKDLQLTKLRLDGISLSAEQYSVDDRSLRVEKVADAFTLEIENLIRPQDNTSLEGLYKSKGLFCTQCEAEGFRRISYSYDRPDNMSTYMVTIIADKKRYPVLLGNGNCIEQGDLDATMHYTKWDDPFPKSCYLFALVAGQLSKITSTFKTQSGRSIELAIYAADEDIDKCQHAMDSLKRAMTWDEETFGLECDLDQYKIVAVSDFNMGAMENKGLNIFNSALILAKPETATDDSFQYIEAVIGHEYFHNWTGNRVTCRDWFQLCLKEGLTVFRDQKFSQDMGSAAVKRIADVRQLKARQWLEDEGPMAHPPRPNQYIEINNFYTATVYTKGAEVVRMLSTLIGWDAFCKGMKLYFERFDGQAVTQEDFVQAMADASGQNLDQFLNWYTQAGTPRVEVKDHYDEKAQRYTLEFKQWSTRPDTKPFHIPLRLALLGVDGQSLDLKLENDGKASRSGASPGKDARERLFSLCEPETRLSFVGLKSRPVPSLFRGFSAAVRAQYPYTQDQLRFLMAHDQDPFNNWDAGQKLFMSTLLTMVQAQQKKKPLTVDPGLTEAFGAVLNNKKFDPAFKALALTLPSEGIIAQEMQVIDVNAIHQARETLRRTLAETYATQIRSLYQQLRDDGPYSLAQDALGKRSLRLRALGFLSAIETKDTHKLVFQHFLDASNMTDSSAALSLLAYWQCPETTEALTRFYEKWQHDDLVIDKWFGVQAGASTPWCLDTVQGLLKHPAFSLKNPNRLRSVLGAVCLANPIAFHHESGLGYRLCADHVLKVDKINRQMAAYLAKAFNQWRRYDDKRQAMMNEELRRIHGQKNLSPDVYEIVDRALRV